MRRRMNILNIKSRSVDEISLSNIKARVWCTLSAKRITGPVCHAEAILICVTGAHCTQCSCKWQMTIPNKIVLRKPWTELLPKLLHFLMLLLTKIFQSNNSIPGYARCFVSPQCSDRLWGPNIFLPTGYRWPFPWGEKLITHRQPVSRSRTAGLYLSSAAWLHAIVLN